jgi:hypothetical protein
MLELNNMYMEIFFIVELATNLYRATNLIYVNVDGF